MKIHNRRGGLTKGNERMSIKKRLLILAVTVIAIVILIAFTGYNASRKLLVRQIEDLSRATTQLADAEATAFLKGRENLLLSALGVVENIWQSRDFDPEPMLNAMEFWGQKGEALQINGVFLVTKDGHYLDSTGWIPPADYIPREQQWYLDTIKNDKLTYSEPYVDAAFTGGTVLTLAAPVKNKSGLSMGIIAIDIDIAELNKFVVSRRINGQGYGMILDANGLVVSHPDEKIAMKLTLTTPSPTVPQELANIARAMVRGEEGHGTYQAEDGLHEVFYASLGQGWSIGVVVPVAELLAPATSLAMIQGGIGAVAIVILGSMLYFVYRSVIRPVTRLRSVMSAVRDGDMTQRIALSGRDEISDVANVVDGVVEEQRDFLITLREQAVDINDNTEKLDDAFRNARDMAKMISDNTRDLARIAEKNSDAIQNVSAGIQEMSAAATGAANAASQVSEEAEDLRRNAEESEGMVKRNTEKVGDMARAFESVTDIVKDLDSKASNINNIVSTITGIADQTNLLALNAAIEAARAGEAGRGFAVVAEEVRKLAEDSSTAANRIGELAGDIVRETATAVTSASNGVSLASATRNETEETQQRLSDVILSISKIVDQIQNVAATSEEQSASLAEMSSAVERVTRGADENKEKSEEIAIKVDSITDSIGRVAGTAESLREMASSNNKHIARYKLDGKNALSA